MRYLLDTNIVIAAMKGNAAVVGRLESTPLANLVLSPVVLGELEFGAEKSAHSERNRARLAELARQAHRQMPNQPLKIQHRQNLF